MLVPTREGQRVIKYTCYSKHSIESIVHYQGAYHALHLSIYLSMWIFICEKIRGDSQIFN